MILLIAILGAIAVPMFLRQRENGYKTQVQSALKNGAVALQSYATKHEGTYTDATIPELQAEHGLRIPQAVTLEPETLSRSAFCLQASHDNLVDQPWRYESSDGVPEPGAC